MALPLILAGPILRRAEPERVCIWMATSEQTTVRGDVYIDSEGIGSEGRKPIGSSDPESGGRETTVRLGDHLFVHLLEAIGANQISLAEPSEILVGVADHTLDSARPVLASA